MGYVDPSAFGVISQIGFIVVFAIGAGVTFLFAPVKRLVARLRGTSASPSRPGEGSDAAESPTPMQTKR